MTGLPRLDAFEATITDVQASAGTVESAADNMAAKVLRNNLSFISIVWYSTNKNSIFSFYFCAQTDIPMNLKDIFRKYSPILAIIVSFIAAACIYCLPALTGKTIEAGDTITYIGAAQETQEYYERTGEHTFWTGSMFCGMPNYQIGGGYYLSDSLLSPVKKLLCHETDGPIWMMIIYFLCFYILMRCFGIERWMSMIGAFAIGLSSYFLVIIPAGHNTKTVTIALTAVVLGGFHLIFRKKYMLGVVLTMLFTSAGFSMHPQAFYYYCLLMGVLWLAELSIHIKEKRIKDLCLATLIFALSLGIGVGTGMSKVFVNSEYAAETNRGGDGLDIGYATDYSYTIDETMSLMIPGFKGGSSSVKYDRNSKLYKSMMAKGVTGSSAKTFCDNVHLYWGEQPYTYGNVYVGAIICFLFLLGLMIVSGPYKWALLAATLFSFALSWGDNMLWLTKLFFKYFPMYSRFRAVSSVLIVAEVTMPLLAILALKTILSGEVDRRKLTRSVLISAGITGGICLFFALFANAIYSFKASTDSIWASNLPDWLYNGVIAERKALMRSDCIRSLALIAGAAAVLLFSIKGKLRHAWTLSILGVLIVGDLWLVDRRYFNSDNYVNASHSSKFVQTDYEKMISQDKDPHFRVLNLTTDTFNESRTSYWFKSLGGYSAVKLRRYDELIDEHLVNNEMPVIGMLNAKYIISSDESGAVHLKGNPYALGNAWFVDRIHIVDNDNLESRALSEIDLSHEAVMNMSFISDVAECNTTIPEDACVKLDSYSPNRLEYTSSSSAAGNVVFSEIWYPHGWKAEIDGKETPIFRVNYVLRALSVPAGRHSIVFSFDPESARMGDRIAAVFIVLMYLLTAVAAVFGIIRIAKARG